MNQRGYNHNRAQYFQPQYEDDYEEEEEEEQLQFFTLEEDHVFSDRDIMEFAVMLGINPQKEQNLLYLAREGLSLPPPHPWILAMNDQNELYFINQDTEDFQREPPNIDDLITRVNNVRKRNKMLQNRDNGKSKKNAIEKILHRNIPAEALKKDSAREKASMKGGQGSLVNMLKPQMSNDSKKNGPIGVIKEMNTTEDSIKNDILFESLQPVRNKRKFQNKGMEDQRHQAINQRDFVTPSARPDKNQKNVLLPKENSKPNTDDEFENLMSSDELKQLARGEESDEMILGHENLPYFDLEGDPNQISEEMSSGIFTGQAQQPQKKFQKKGGRKAFQKDVGMMREPNKFKPEKNEDFEEEFSKDMDLIQDIQDFSKDEVNISGIDFESSKEANIVEQNFDAKRKSFKQGSSLAGIGSPTSDMITKNFGNVSKQPDVQNSSGNNIAQQIKRPNIQQLVEDTKQKPTYQNPQNNRQNNTAPQNTVGAIQRKLTEHHADQKAHQTDSRIKPNTKLPKFETELSVEQFSDEHDENENIQIQNADKSKYSNYDLEHSFDAIEDMKSVTSGGMSSEQEKQATKPKLVQNEAKTTENQQRKKEKEGFPGYDLVDSNILMSMVKQIEQMNDKLTGLESQQKLAGVGGNILAQENPGQATQTLENKSIESNKSSRQEIVGLKKDIQDIKSFLEQSLVNLNSKIEGKLITPGPVTQTGVANLQHHQNGLMTNASTYSQNTLQYSMMNPNSFVAQHEHKEVNPVFRSSFADFKIAANNPVEIPNQNSQIQPNQSRISPLNHLELHQATAQNEQDKLLEKTQLTLKFYTKWSRVINKSVNELTRQRMTLQQTKAKLDQRKYLLKQHEISICSELIKLNMSNDHPLPVQIRRSLVTQIVSYKDSLKGWKSKAENFRLRERNLELLRRSCESAYELGSFDLTLDEKMQDIYEEFLKIGRSVDESELFNQNIADVSVDDDWEHLDPTEGQYLVPGDYKYDPNRKNDPMSEADIRFSVDSKETGSYLQRRSGEYPETQTRYSREKEEFKLTDIPEVVEDEAKDQESFHKKSKELNLEDADFTETVELDMDKNTPLERKSDKSANLASTQLVDASKYFNSQYQSTLRKQKISPSVLNLSTPYAASFLSLCTSNYNTKSDYLADLERLRVSHAHDLRQRLPAEHLENSQLKRYLDGQNYWLSGMQDKLKDMRNILRMSTYQNPYF